MRGVWQHNTGGGARYTEHRRPVVLVYYEEYERVSEDYGREKQVQNWGSMKREALINGQQEDLPWLSRASAECRPEE